jgi:hypothetical protein
MINNVLNVYMGALREKRGAAEQTLIRSVPGIAARREWVDDRT